jgi:hypothetical protein
VSIIEAERKRDIVGGHNFNLSGICTGTKSMVKDNNV